MTLKIKIGRFRLCLGAVILFLHLVSVGSMNSPITHDKEFKIPNCFWSSLELCTRQSEEKKSANSGNVICRFLSTNADPIGVESMNKPITHEREL